MAEQDDQKQAGSTGGHYLQSVLDSIADPVFVKNMQHQWIDGNRAFWELMGAPREHFSGKTDYDVFPKEEADVFWKQDNKVFSSGEPDINEEFLTDRTGVRHFISTKKTLLRNEQGEKVLVGIIRDITAQKELEQLKARLDEANVYAMAESVPALVWMSAPNGECHYFNHAWLEFTGRTIAQEKGDGWRQGIHQDDSQHCSAIYASHAQTRTPFEMTYRLRRHDGQYRWLLSKGQPRMDATGAFAGYTGACIDVTERRLAQDALKESEARLSAIHNQAGVGIVQTDLSTRILTANPRFCEIVGRSEKTLQGLTLGELTHPDDVPATMTQLQTLLADGKPMIVEKRYTTPDGRTVYVNNAVSLINRQSGEPWLITAVVQDITARHEIEAALRRAERQYRNIFESTSDAILIVDKAGMLVEVNPAACAMYGYAREELISRSAVDLTLDRDKMRFASFSAALSAENQHFRESLHIRKDGTLLDVEASGTTLDYQGKPHILVIIRDVTERRQTELRSRFLEELSQTMRLASNADEVMAAAVRGVGKHFAASRCILAKFTHDQKEVIATHQYDLGLPPVPKTISLDRFDAAGTEELRRGRVVAVSDVAHDPRTSRAIDLFDAMGTQSFMCIIIPRPKGPVGILAVHDARPRTWTATDQAFLQQIASRIGVMADMAQAHHDLIHADRRKDEFLATLAHELRNPLAPIRNALAAIAHSGGSESMRKKAIATIDRQVEHMVHLVDDLLDVSRITQDKIKLRLEACSLEDVIRHAAETCAPMVEARRQTLSVDMPDAPVWLNADAARASQIFSNLLNNATKYTEQGGHIRVAARLENGQAVVTVSDNGIGIPAEMLPRIFELFTQVDGSLERAQGGLGIGLTLVRKLVELHGGSVEARSRGKDKGSEFVVSLPCCEAPVQTRAAPPTEAAGSGLRVLIVDDNQPSAQTMGWMMELCGHEVRLAFDGPTAISLAVEWQPHVALLDIGLPVMNGYEVCAAMRREPSLSDTLFIAQTGWGQEEHRQRSREAGFRYHLVKPVDMNELKRLMHEVQHAQAA